MNNQFDELTKGIAQSVTRRAALKKFGVGLAGMALACFGLANKAEATTITGYCVVEGYPKSFKNGGWGFTGQCTGMSPNGSCYTVLSADCPSGKNATPHGGMCAHAVGNRTCSFTV